MKIGDSLIIPACAARTMHEKRAASAEQTKLYNQGNTGKKGKVWNDSLTGVRQCSQPEKTFASAIKRLKTEKRVQPCYLEFKNTKTVLS